jgi:hypothetical protein
LKRRVVTLKLTGVSEVCTAINALMMAAVRTTETTTNFNVTTLRYIPEDSKLHTRRRDNLISSIYDAFPNTTKSVGRILEVLNNSANQTSLFLIVTSREIPSSHGGEYE